MNERHLMTLGWAASIMAVGMYVSYIDQIVLNLAGQKGSVILPIATVANAGLWALYGFARPKRDWPMVVANVPGIVLGAATAVTALV